MGTVGFIICIIMLIVILIIDSRELHRVYIILKMLANEIDGHSDRIKELEAKIEDLTDDMK